MNGDDRFAAPDNYKQKYVAFIDILGFSDMVEVGDASPSARIDILRALQLLQDSLCEDKSIEMKLRHFSDCVVLSAVRNPSGLLEMLISIDLLTSNLLQYDVLVRGGLSVGGIHHDDDILFGIGVNRSYTLEHHKAVFPRTVISSDVVSDAETFSDNEWKNTCTISDYITKDEKDGLSFVDYFRKYAVYDPDAPRYPGTVVLSYPARRIIDLACNRLNNTSDGKVLKKVEWLQEYWNRTVAVKGVFRRIEAGVQERDLVEPTILYRRKLESMNN